MLNIRNLISKKSALSSATIDTVIRKRSMAPPRAWTPPAAILNVNPSEATRAAFALFEAQTNYSLQDFIQMRVERLTRWRKPLWEAVLEVNCTYARGPDGEIDISRMFRLLLDELDDWMLHDNRDKDAARPLTYLAACMWSLGDWDKAATLAARQNSPFLIRSLRTKIYLD